MMSLAQRVRDFRYSKGWGPDELAHRAEISRTALYQIESGKTELPRAGTLRRIALALNVSMDDLLGDEQAAHAAARPRLDVEPAAESAHEWFPSEGAPLTLPSSSLQGLRGLGDDRGELGRASLDAMRRTVSSQEAVLRREGEMMSKLHDILHSPVGASMARIVDELHGMISKSRQSI